MRSNLIAWYSARRQAHPDEQLTKLSGLTKRVVGTPSDQHCNTKGAETWTLVIFLLDELRKYNALLGPDWQRLLPAGESLEQLVLLWRWFDWIIPEEQREDTFC